MAITQQKIIIGASVDKPPDSLIECRIGVLRGEWRIVSATTALAPIIHNNNVQVHYVTTVIVECIR